MSTPEIIQLVLPLFFVFCLIVFIITIIYKIITGQELSKRGGDDYYNHNHFDSGTINPASGLPMSGGVDVAGNAYGQNNTSSFHEF